MTKEDVKNEIDRYNHAKNPFLQTWINQLTYKEYLDCDVDEKWIDFSYNVRKEAMNRIGTLHGGLVAGAMDEAMGYAALVFRPAGTHPTTSDMQFNCLKAMKLGDEIRIHCMVRHVGKRSMVVQSEMWRGKELCAISTENFGMIEESKIKAHLQNCEKKE